MKKPKRKPLTVFAVVAQCGVHILGLWETRKLAIRDKRRYWNSRIVKLVEVQK